MVATKQILTLEKYLRYDDGSDHEYELVAGELVKMPPLFGKVIWKTGNFEIIYRCGCEGRYGARILSAIAMRLRSRP